ncbi:MAG: DUF4258 domain-containing protein [Thiobacillus sp.]
MTKFSKRQIERVIRDRSVITANVLMTDHARKRMKERRITLAMVYEVLRKGNMPREPELNLRHGSLECRMERYLEGREIAVIVALDLDATDLPVVTVMNI